VLDAFLKRFPPERLVVDILRIDDRADAVYAAGSCVEGLAHELSDLDLYVLSPEVYRRGTRLTVDGVALEVTEVGDVQLDVERWPLNAVRNLARAVSEIDPRGLQRSRPLTLDEITFCHRLKTGVPLWNGPLIDRIRSWFDFRVFQAGMRNRSMQAYENLAEDSLGCLAAGDYATAFAAAESALRFAVGAYLASRGETNPARKWHLRLLLSRPSDDELAGRVWTALNPALPSPRAAREIASYVEKTLDLASDLAALAQRGDDADG